MAHEFRTTRSIEFVDTDIGGIMHFPNFFRYMESAETAFFFSLEFPLGEQQLAPLLAWPRVYASCQYRSPLCFQNLVEIQLLVRQIRTKSIRFTFIFRKLNGASVKVVARGEVSVVCATVDSLAQNMKSVSMRKWIRDKLEVATSEVPETHKNRQSEETRAPW